MAKVKVYEDNYEARNRNKIKRRSESKRGSPHRTTQKESEHHCGI